jgi:hypothetical protein
LFFEEYIGTLQEGLQSIIVSTTLALRSTKKITDYGLKHAPSDEETRKGAEVLS